MVGCHTPQPVRLVRLPEWPGACVQLEDFVNQQVGHSESEKHDDYDKGEENGKGGEATARAKRMTRVAQAMGRAKAETVKSGNGDERQLRKWSRLRRGQDARCSSYHVVKAGEGLYDIGHELSVRHPADVGCQSFSTGWRQALGV